MQSGRPDLEVFHSITKTDEKGKGRIVVANAYPEPIVQDKGMKITRMTEVMNNLEVPSKRKVAEMNELREPRREPNPLRPGRREKFLEKLNIQCMPDRRKDYERLCLKYHDMFSKDEYDLGWTDRVSHRIELKDKQPIYVKQFRIPQEHHEKIQDFVHDMLNRKLIEVARSRYNSPIFLSLIHI